MVLLGSQLTLTSPQKATNPSFYLALLTKLHFVSLQSPLWNTLQIPDKKRLLKTSNPGFEEILFAHSWESSHPLICSLPIGAEQIREDELEYSFK